MKNLKTPMALAILLAAAPAVNAADLTISGEIMETTCAATIKGGLAVAMDKVDLEDLKGSNRVGRRALDVEVDCTGASGSHDVAVKFTGVTTADGALALDGTGDAEGVAFKIYDVNDDQLAINATPTEFVNVTASAPQTIQHSVWYTKTGIADDVVAGKAYAKAQMDIVYK
ncbi:fimbrial protein [Stenotrophomonas maltophilia]|uniref:fimbrial protein n=1 Tax=Stenotrophomonas maltophilia TaxID=40324 RepID=UPI0022F3E185|nr:fimbrial protein [Stenotrophomonas maltophilia]MDA5342063.1 fimbrial protein [Stenotrophomonas maltophilia]